MTKGFLRKTDGVLFIFDITNKEYFDDIKTWYELYKEENEEVVGLLIGNKCDRELKVNKEEAKHFAEEHRLKYLETSAKLDKNLRKAIACLLEKIIKFKENIEAEDNEEFDKIKKLNASYFSLNSDDAISPNENKKQRKKICSC